MYSCGSCEDYGSFDLGNDLVLLEGDRAEDRIIVLCNIIKRNNGCCNGGISIFPLYEEHMINGDYATYVDWVVFNEEWIIIKYSYLEYNYSDLHYILIDKKKLKDANSKDESYLKQVRETAIGPINLHNLQDYILNYNIDTLALRKI